MGSTPEILLVDDEGRELDTLSRLIAEYYSGGPRSEKPFRGPRCFKSPAAALEYLASGMPADIIFLDIIMPEMTGVETARRLREKGFAGYIVFLTSVNDFASESYMVRAFSYLLKPVERERLFSVLGAIEADKAESQKRDSAALMIQTRGYQRNILFRKMVFVEVMGRTLYIHLENGETVSINKPLKEFAPALLGDRRFSRCHSSIIVNMEFVETIKGDTAALKTGQSVPISRRNHEFKSRYISYAIGGSGGTA